MTDFQKYVQRYLDLIPSEDWLGELKKSGEKTVEIYSNLRRAITFCLCRRKMDSERTLLHLSDTERSFQYRILAFARGDKNELPGFDEELYAKQSFANERTLSSLLEEYQLIRKSSQILLETANSEALKI
jgi:hypothetical protein